MDGDRWMGIGGGGSCSLEAVRPIRWSGRVGSGGSNAYICVRTFLPRDSLLNPSLDILPITPSFNHPPPITSKSVDVVNPAPPLPNPNSPKGNGTALCAGYDVIGCTKWARRLGDERGSQRNMDILSGLGVSGWSVPTWAGGRPFVLCSG